jgi:hypothetical protein
MTKSNTIKILAYQFGGILSITVRVVIFLCLIPLRISSCEQGVKNSVPFTTGDYVVMGLFGLGVSYLVYTIYKSWSSKPDSDPFPDTPDTAVTQHKIKIYMLKKRCEKELGHMPDEIEFQEWFLRERARRMDVNISPQPTEPVVEEVVEPTQAQGERQLLPAFLAESKEELSVNSTQTSESKETPATDFLNQSFMVEPTDLNPLSENTSQPVVEYDTVMSPTTRRLYLVPDTYSDISEDELNSLFFHTDIGVGLPTQETVSTPTVVDTTPRFQPRVIPSWEQPRDLSAHPNIFHPELGLENDSTYKICLKAVARAEEILKTASPEDVLMRQRQLALATRSLEEYCHAWYQKAVNMGFTQPSTLTESTTLELGLYSWFGGGHA